MIKGHTKIILTNVETGEQEVHEDDNLVTNALDKIINIEMSMNHQPNQYILPIATNALGGIMLFDGPLTESVDNIHFPTEAHLVGYANTSVNTSDTHRGSYNSAESGKTDDGFVSVWDFGTSQANGEIKSVARTHNHGGACPFYNYMSPDYWDTITGAPKTDTYWYPIRYDGEYLYMIKNNSNTHQMRLARTKIPRLRMGVADYSDVARSYEVIATWDTFLTNYTYYNHDYEYEQKKNPHTRAVYADVEDRYIDGGDGYFYVVGWGPTTWCSDYEYDLTYFTIKYGDGSFTKSETIRKHVGLTGYCDNSYGFYFFNRSWYHIHKGTFYFCDNKRKCINIVPLDNVASYRTIRILSDDISDYISYLERVAPREGGVYFEVYHYTATSWHYRHGIMYPDGTYIIPNVSYAGTGSYHGNNSQNYGEVWTNDDDLIMWGCARDTYCYFYWAANYLGTINNLSSPITKTAAQTMKIIYTLKNVDE